MKSLLNRLFPRSDEIDERVAADAAVTEERAARVQSVVSDLLDAAEGVAPHSSAIDEIHRLERRAAKREP